jgi:transposase InsO family protein
MNRKPSASVALRNQTIVQRIHALKADHPFWGYRRIWAHLRFVDKLQVNKKRILRLMRQQDLLVKPNLRLKAKRTSTKSKPRPTAPNQWWGIDMTKVLVESFGWIYVVIVLDWYTKKIVGYYAGVQCKAVHWLSAVNMAANRQFPNGIKGHDVHLMSDNGCQPTSIAFMQACDDMGIHQAFTSYCNPKGNADTERIMRTIKEECLWLKEWTSPFHLSNELEHWIEVSYNQDYLHSTLGYKSPLSAESDYLKSHITQFAAP